MDNTSRQKLHDLMVEQNLYSKSYNEFENQFSNPESQKKLYGLLKKEGLYSKPESEFSTQFFASEPAVEKKKIPPTPKGPTALPSTSTPPKSSLALGQQVVTGPSASFTAAPVKKFVQPQKPVRQSEGTLLQPTKTAEGLDVPDRFNVIKQGWKNLDTDISTNVNKQRQNQNSQLQDLTLSANRLDADRQKFEQKVTQFDAEYKSNPNNPALKQKQDELIKEQSLLNSRLDSFKFQKNALKNSNAVVSQAIKDKNATISTLEDYGNELLSAGAGAFATLLTFPAYVQNTVLDLELAANGLDDDFNRLPASAKKEVRRAVLSASAGQVDMNAGVNSQRAFDYFNKISKKIHERTIEYEGDVFDMAADFASDPSVEKATNILNKATKSFIGSVPYMAMAAIPGGAVTQALASAGGKRLSDIEEDQNAGLGYAFTAALHGSAEGFFESKTNEIIARAAKYAMGNPKAVKDLTEGLFKRILKDFGEEGLSEGLTTLFQQTQDQINKGEPIDLVKLARQIGESALLGGVTGAGITSAGAGFGKVKKSIAGEALLTNSLITAEDRAALEKIRNTTQDLQTQVADDNNPAVNQAITQEIDKLKSDYDQITAKYTVAVENLTEDEARSLFEVEEKINQIKEKAKAIKEDPNLTEDAKTLLWKNLKQEFEPLKEQRDAIQKQATGKVSIQPEAGTSLQVAEGEPQAEPQVPTEEVKTEKIGQALDADNTFTMRGKEGNLFVDDNGQVLFESGDEIVELGNIADVQDSNLSDFGIEPKAPVEINIGEDGSITVSGKKYVNPSENTMDAISFDQDGNVKAVRLETENGLSRYFRGKRAESIAYQYTLQNFENNATDEQLDNAINQAAEIAATEGAPQQVTAEGPVEVVEPTEEVVVEEGKPKAPPSAKKILGIKSKKVTVDEMASLKGQLRLQAKAAKTAYDFAESARKLVAAYIKKNVQGALSATNQKALFRAMEGKLDTPENKKKMIDKVTKILQGSQGNISIKELDALGRMYKSMEKGSKLGAKAVMDQLKSAVDTIKSMGVKNQLKPAQVRLLLNGLKKNLLNPTVRENFLASAQRILNNAEHAQNILDAQKLRSRIRKTLKTGKEIAEVEKSVREFLKLDPKMIEDVQEYMDYAEEIFGAIRNVQVKDGKAFGKRAAVLANIDAYATKENAIQDEINKNMLLDEYKYLVDAGLISDKMSFEDINKYIELIEKDPTKVDSTKSDILREYTKEAFAGFADTAKQMLEDGEYDEQDVDFEMINNFINMDIEALPLIEQVNAVESLENFIVNGTTSRMGAVYRSYIGVENSQNNLESGLVARPLSYGLIGRLSYLKNVTDKAVIGNILSGIASIGDLYNNLEAIYISKTDSLISTMFRSTTKGIKFLKDSGFSGVVRGFVEGKKIANDFAKKYAEKFDGSKPNGIDFKSALNIYERGIFADLSRTILNGTPEQIQAEFDRKKKQLKMTIDTLRETKKKDSIAKADLYDTVYNKIEKAKNIDEVKANIDPINQAAVKEIQDMWKKYYPEFRRMAADYYNVMLDEDANYVPDMYEKLAMATADDLLVKSTFKMAFDVVSTEEVGTFKKNQKIDGLPKDANTNKVNRVRDYDFDYNNITALEKTLVDVRTTPSVQQFMGYTQSAAFEQIFPDFDEREMITKRLNFNINALRERQDTYSSKTAKMFNKFTTALSRYGTRIGLGSLSSAPKQSIPMVTNTAINMIGDLDSFGMSFKDIFDKDAIAFLDNSGYGISLRGSEAQTSIDYAEKLVEQANLGKAGNITEALSKIGDKYIELFLKNPDVFVANMAWLGYYRSKLKSMGVDMSTFDWKNHELNEEAADYAEFMVQDQQNMNVSELGGKLLASKDATTKVIRQLLFPFASYQFNLKDKNNRNITILTSKTSSNEDKIQAGKSLAAGMVEAYTFQTIQSLIAGMLLAAAYSAIGYDEPEDEKTDGILDAIAKAMPFVRSTSTREKWNDELFAGKSIFEFVAPIPNQLEYVTLLGLNQAMDYIQGGTPEEILKKQKEEAKNEELNMFGKPLKKKRGAKKTEEEKKAAKTQEQLDKPFRFFAKEEVPYGQVFSDMIGGVPSVGYESLSALAISADEAFAGSYKDKYGNEYTYSDEQKKILKQSLIPKTMVAMNIAPREFLTIGNNIEKAVKAKAKEDAKAAKEGTKKKEIRYSY